MEIRGMKAVAAILILIMASGAGKSPEAAWKAQMDAGDVAWEGEQLAEAERAYRSATIVARKFASGDPRVAESALRLGQTLAEEGKPDEAEPLLRQAAATLERTNGRERDLSEAYVSLGDLAHDGERYEDAATLFFRALLLEERALGENDPEVARTLRRLADAYHDEDDDERAEPFYRRAVTVCENAFGKEDEEVAWACLDLGRFLHDAARFAEAEAVLGRSQKVLEAARGSGDPSVGVVLAAEGRLLHDAQRWKESEQRYRKAVKLLEKGSPSSDPDLSDALLDFAELLRDDGRDAEADAVESRGQALRDAKGSGGGV